MVFALTVNLSDIGDRLLIGAYARRSMEALQPGAVIKPDEFEKTKGQGTGLSLCMSNSYRALIST